MSAEQDQFKHFAGQPFIPPLASGGSIEMTIGLRIANALEYIAAQLGDINRKLSIINATGDLKDRAIQADLRRAQEILSHHIDKS